MAKLGNKTIPAFENIYGSTSDQKSAVLIFTQIDQIRKHLTNDLISGINQHSSYLEDSQPGPLLILLMYLQPWIYFLNRQGRPR